MTLPGLGDHVPGCKRRWLDPYLVSPQPIKARHNRHTGRAGLEPDVLQQGRQEDPHGAIACLQLAVVHVVRRAHQRLDVHQRLFQRCARNAREHRVAQLAVGKRRIEYRPAGRRQHRGGLIKIFDTAPPRLLVGFGGIAEERMEQQVQHFDYVVLGRCLQAVDEGDQGSQAAHRRQTADGGDLGGAGKARERGEPAGWNTGRRQPDTQIAHGLQALDRLHQGASTHPYRS